MESSSGTAHVTPTGVRDGDLPTLQALCARRGPAVYAYCLLVADIGHAAEAAAEAFAQFRADVAAAEDPRAMDAERLLMAKTRRTAASFAPHPAALDSVLRRAGAHRGTDECADVPELLAAEAEGGLSEEHAAQLAEHIDHCPFCQAARARFEAAEHAYHHPPARTLPNEVTEEIVHAMVEALFAPGERSGAVSDSPEERRSLGSTARTARARRRRRRMGVRRLIIGVGGLAILVIVLVVGGVFKSSTPQRSTTNIFTPTTTTAGRPAGFPAAIYPSPVSAKRHSALTKCPASSGLVAFSPKAAAGARTIATSYRRRSQSYDLKHSDQAWWSNVRKAWKKSKGRRAAARAALLTEAASKTSAASAIQRSCGTTVVKRSLAVTIGASKSSRAGKNAPRSSTLFFIDRRGTPLLYWAH